MSQGAPEMGQGAGTLTRAAGLVAEAKADFDNMSNALSSQIQGLQGRWAGAGGSAFFGLHLAWTEKQKIITQALNEFEASLTSTERDNVGTDESQSSTFTNYASRLG